MLAEENEARLEAMAFSSSSRSRSRASSRASSCSRRPLSPISEKGLYANFVPLHEASVPLEVLNILLIHCPLPPKEACGIDVVDLPLHATTYAALAAIECKHPKYANLVRLAIDPSRAHTAACVSYPQGNEVDTAAAEPDTHLCALAHTAACVSFPQGTKVVTERRHPRRHSFKLIACKECTGYTPENEWVCRYCDHATVDTAAAEPDTHLCALAPDPAAHRLCALAPRPCSPLLGCCPPRRHLWQLVLPWLQLAGR